MTHEDPRDPNVPPREDPDDVDDTINPDSDVDEASYESFPASDAPGWRQRQGPEEVEGADDEEAAD